jgi:LEA14-like dessication related protein
VNTKLVAILVSAIAVGAIALFSTGALGPQLTPTSSCNTENPNLLAGGFTASQGIPYTYTVKVHNAQSEAVRLTSYTLGTQLYSIDVAIAAGQNGTFTTVQDANSESWIPVKTSCGNQIMTAWASSETYTENIAPTSVAFEDSTHVAVELQNNGTGTATLTTYYVTDSSGNEYTLANWSGPSIAPNSTTTTTFSIGSSCPQCTLHGSAFTFTSGSQYTIEVVTGRGNIFTFTVTWISGHHYSIVLQIGFGSTAH